MNNLRESITRHAFFRGMKPDHLSILAKCAKAASYKAGEVLFCEGEPADRFFLIESGRVVLEAHEPADGTELIEEIGPGDVMGWSWLFAPFVWHFGARVAEPTTAIILSGAHLLITAETDHNFGYELMKRITQVVIHRLQATRKRLLDLQIEAALEG